MGTDGPASHASAPAMGLREWTMLLALSGLWGGSFFFIKLLVNELPSFTIGTRPRWTRRDDAEPLAGGAA